MGQQQPDLNRNPKSRAMWDRACNVIVGGGQAHKRPLKYMLRGGPAFVERASGSRIWDLDGHSYVDYLLSYGPILLGHCDPELNVAIQEQLQRGTIFTVEHPQEVELAEKLCELIPCAEQVGFYVGGSAATEGAIRCARHLTGREKIVRCGYHGWHDWCFPSGPGVPKFNRELIIEIPYNDLNALKQIFERERGQVAGVIIEAIQGAGPSPQYFPGVRQLCDEHGVIFILDEVKTGFRFELGGAQVPFKIDADLATFGKAMCNGYPGSIVAGKRKYLERCVDCYVSATFHGDALSTTAALTTIRLMEQRKGIAYLERIGKRLIDGLNQVFVDKEYPCSVVGFAPMPQPQENPLNHPERPITPELQGKALSEFCAAMQRRGHYITGHCWFLSLAHSDADVDSTIGAAEDAIREARLVLKS